MEKEDIYILAVESSCDETAASVVRNGREVLSNIIYSQIDLHTLYGGVVPEIASRKHIEKVNQVIEKALSDAGITLEEVTAVAVTYGPRPGGGASGRSIRSKGHSVCRGQAFGRSPSYRRTYQCQFY